MNINQYRTGEAAADAHVLNRGQIFVHRTGSFEIVILPYRHMPELPTCQATGVAKQLVKRGFLQGGPLQQAPT